MPGTGEVRESSKSTVQREAVDLLTQRLVEVKQGTCVVDRKVTVVDLLVDLEGYYEDRSLRSLPSLRGYIHALTAPGAIGTLPAARLTTARLTRLVESWKAASIKPASINRRLAALRRAYRLGKDTDPPKVLRVPRMPLQTENNVRTGFFDKTTFDQVLAGLPSDGLQDFVEWAFWTGMRRGEISKLSWTDFDRETWWLTLPGRITKNGRPKGIPVCTDEMRAIMLRRLAAHEAYPDCGRIFFRVEAGKAIPTRTFDKAWLAACRAARCEGRLFHDLRRTGVRNLVRAGVPRAIAMLISGHRTEAVFERYNIVVESELVEALHRVSAYVRQLSAESPTTLAVPSEAPTTPETTLH
jgi:integrase